MEQLEKGRALGTYCINLSTVKKPKREDGFRVQCSSRTVFKQGEVILKHLSSQATCILNQLEVSTLLRHWLGTAEENYDLVLLY